MFLLIMKNISRGLPALIAGILLSIIGGFLLAEKQASSAQTVVAPSASAKPRAVLAQLPSGGRNTGAGGGAVAEIVMETKTGAPPATVATKANGGAPNLITVAFDNVPVQDVVNMFAQISGANIIMAGAFTNLFITANLKNVEWKSALNLALGSVNLAMIEDASGILMVVSADVYPDKLKEIEASKPLITRTIVPRYMNAVDLVGQIKLLNILSPRGTIITSQSAKQDIFSLKSSPLAADIIQNPSITTAIIITDIKEYVDKVEALIKALDNREPQVFIEARIINVTSGDSKKLGFDWGMLDRFGAEAGLKDLVWTYKDEQSVKNQKDNKRIQEDFRRNQDNINKFYDVSAQQYEESETTFEESPPESGNWIARTKVTPTREIGDQIIKRLDISAGGSDTIIDSMAQTRTATAFLNFSQVSLFLSALERNNNAEMISHPQIVVGNRMEAKIHVGSRYPSVITSKTAGNPQQGLTEGFSDKVEWIDLGLTLWVIPEIDMMANIVRLTVVPSTKQHDKDIETKTGSILPVIVSRDLTTRVNVPSGHTVAIGGLVEDQKSKIEKKVPLLGDIPLLGLLFRHTEDVISKNNLIVLITPTILDDSKPLTGLEAQAQQTIDRLEKVPLAAVKAVPSNAVQSVTIGTNAVTPAAGLGRPAPSAPVSTVPPVATTGTPVRAVILPVSQ